MRWIGDIDHKYLKIAAFQMGTRLSLQFSNGEIEYVFKLRDNENLRNLSDLKALLTSDFLVEIEDSIEKMQSKLIDNLREMNRKNEADDDFPSII
ncbi:MAG TPA: hypothetical protein PK147_06140 [Saprospiraceae bacterium]|nr:hypothetical protein [Saprospiraceae bacterium]MCB9328450.1 hypothetical protein [Lewinellaceae bacterium]HPQ21410.1 hypothetical protein [Saprospiraceae bacterium]HRX28096.1 hypothetical protein [Saprospiraceae bacterium]